MRGFPHRDYFPAVAAEKVATLLDRLGAQTSSRVTVRTACNENAETILLARPEALIDAGHNLAFVTGSAALVFDGKVYGFHHFDQSTKDIIFWPLGHAAVTDVCEGREHIDRFENEGGIVPPTRPLVSATGYVGGHPAHFDDDLKRPLTYTKTRLPDGTERVNPNAEGGVNWPIGGDRPD